MKTLNLTSLTAFMIPFAAYFAAQYAAAQENTYYIWAGAEAANEEVDPFTAGNWSVSDTEYAAPPEGTDMNSPDANWVFDYGAYLPVSGRQDGFYYRIWHSMFQANSISIINHNAMDTGYWAGDGFHQTGGSTSIKLVSGASNPYWNIGVFTYTGAAPESYWDSGVTFGASNSNTSQAEISVGEMNIGSGENYARFNIGSEAAGIGRATIDEGDTHIGDSVYISDSAGPKRLTVFGNFNISGNAIVNMNVWDNAADAVHSESVPDVAIDGIVNMARNSSGKSPIWNLLNRSSTVTWARGDPAMPATDTYIKIGGLAGTGTVANNSRTLEASAVKLIFANKTDCEFSGAFTENSVNMDGEKTELNTVMSVKMAGRDGAKQIIRADAEFTGGVEVESGALIIHSTSALGKLAMTGGGFGGIDGGVTVSSAEWLGGDIIFYNADALASGLPDMLRIEGTFSKSGGGKIGIDFSGFDASAFIEDGTVLELITANALEGFSEDANDDFAAKNLLNGFADFEWAGNTLTVSFSAVPEPAAIAAILGAVALVSAALRRRK